MESVPEILRTHSEALQHNSHVELSHYKYLNVQPPEPDTPHIDVEVEAAFHELRLVKEERVMLRTKRLVMEAILSASSLDDLPSPQQTARAEVAVEQAKSKLRKAKQARRNAEKELAASVQSFAKSRVEQQQAYDALDQKIRRANAAYNAFEVKEILERRDMGKIEEIVNDIDSYDAACCDDIVAILQEETERVGRMAKDKSEVVDRLGKEVEELQRDVVSLKNSSEDHKSKIAENDRQMVGAAEIRHECNMQDQLEEILSSLSGVKVSDVRANGLSFDINAPLFVKRFEGSSRKQPSHILDVEFEDEGDLGMSTILEMAIRPPDVTVNDLCKDSSISLTTAVRSVCMRLTSFLEGTDCSESLQSE